MNCWKGWHPHDIPIWYANETLAAPKKHEVLILPWPGGHGFCGAKIQHISQWIAEFGYFERERHPHFWDILAASGSILGECQKTSRAPGFWIAVRVYFAVFTAWDLSCCGASHVKHWRGHRWSNAEWRSRVFLCPAPEPARGREATKTICGIWFFVFCFTQTLNFKTKKMEVFCPYRSKGYRMDPFRATTLEGIEFVD